MKRQQSRDAFKNNNGSQSNTTAAGGIGSEYDFPETGRERHPPEGTTEREGSVVSNGAWSNGV